MATLRKLLAGVTEASSSIGMPESAKASRHENMAERGSLGRQ